MEKSEQPSAFRVPICVRSSSTIRVIVVTQTSSAIKMKNTGKTLAMPSMMDVSFLKLAYPLFSARVSTVVDGASMP